MRKHILLALASAVITGFCFGAAPAAQQSGGPKGAKPKKTKTTPAGVTQPAPTGETRPAALPRPAAPAAPSPEASAKGGAPVFKEVTKEKFKEIYFRLGGGKRSR